MGWILVGSLGGLCAALSAEDAALRLATATGLVEIKAALMQEWIAVEAGELLLAGDLLRTRAESSAQVTCPDGSQLTLAPETTLDLRKASFENETHTLTLEVVLWQGRVTLIAQPLPPPSLLRLRTPEFTFEPSPQGAQMELAYTRTTGTTMTVLDRAVTLNRGGSNSLLRAGQSFPGGSSPAPRRGPEKGTAEPPPVPPAEGSEGPPSEPASPHPSTPPPTEAPPAGVPAAIWERMSPEEQADLEERLPTMTEEQRKALIRLTVAEWQVARAAARTLTCQTHLQKIGAAFLRYAQEHEGALPRAEEWTWALFPYLEAGASWDCPEEGHDHTFDYLFNRHLSGVRLSDLRQPRLTILAFEGTPGDASATGGEANLAPRHEGAVNVLFADGHVRTMTLPLYRNVRWQP